MIHKSQSYYSVRQSTIFNDEPHVECEAKIAKLKTMLGERDATIAQLQEELEAKSKELELEKINCA